MIVARDLRVDYLEQDPQYPEELTVLEACFHHGNSTVELIKEYERCMETEGHPGLDEILVRMDQEKAWEYEQKAKQILSQLKIRDFNQQVKSLSGGQLKRVALANTLITEPDLLILDEPTNHLDLDMTEWLEDYLRRTNLTLLMVTHDRYFLDRVCSEIVEIDNRRIYQYKGNYSYYLEKREERIEAKTVEIERANNLYRTELEWMRRMPQARGHKARYREDAFYELEKVAKQRFNNDNVKLDVKASYIGSKIFEADHLCKSFGDLKILDDFSYIFARYEKMGIVGNNGTGKSTFIKILMGDEKADSGTLDIGETVRFGYYSQDGLQFDEQMKVIDVVQDIAEVIELGNGKRLTASQFLQHFLFTPETQHSYVYKLSGGERRRLYLCTVLMRNPNFLVLDEPTSFLDIRHKLELLTILKQMVLDHQLTVIMSLHELDLAQKISDKVICVHGEYIEKYGAPEEIFTSEYIQKLYGITRGSYNAAFGCVEMDPPRGEPQVFVIGGNGSGIPYYRKLQRQGIPFAAGVLHTNDVDCQVAGALADQVITEKPFESISQESYDKAVELMKKCQKVICPLKDFGTVNAANRELLRLARELGILAEL